MKLMYNNIRGCELRKMRFRSHFWQAVTIFRTQLQYTLLTFIYYTALFYIMKRRYRDIAGQRFGHLIAIKYVGSTKGGRARWNCKCDCGKESIVLQSSLVTGNTTSCGCVLKAKITRHGMSNTKLYKVWQSMKTRCSNPKSNRFRYYGGKGITYDPTWETFEGFYTDMHEGYKEGITLDRIDRAKGYSKENCRWVNVTAQNNNKSDNLSIFYRGRWHTPKQIAELVGLPRSLVYNRKRAGWSDERLVSTHIMTKFTNITQ